MNLLKKHPKMKIFLKLITQIKIKNSNTKTLKLEKDLIRLKNLKNLEINIFKMNKKKLNLWLNFTRKYLKKKQKYLTLFKQKKKSEIIKK